jgi:hypothetical protein
MARYRSVFVCGVFFSLDLARGNRPQQVPAHPGWLRKPNRQREPQSKQRVAAFAEAQ